MSLTLNNMLGKEVKLYPGDTDKQKGILKEANAHGFLFEITESSNTSRFKPGELHFISKGSPLSFSM
jgi:hypothetical protein